MKKIISTLLIVACFIAYFTVIVSANEVQSPAMNVEEVVSVRYFEDGSYLIRTRKQFIPASTASTKGAIYEKIGTEDFNYYNADDVLQWTYTIVGTYTINTGVSATCTASSYRFTAHKSGWSFTNTNNSYSGNTAYGSGTAVKKILFITTFTYNLSVYLSCDAYGNLS